MARLRIATADDGDAIRSVFLRNGLGDFDTSEWRYRWQAHPFRAEFSEIPPGWVVEADDGSVVGTYANVHMVYELGLRRLRGCIGAEWGVDPGHRNMSMPLLAAFLLQRNIDVRINGSANQDASKILTGLKVSRIPAADYDVPCLWPIHRRNFAAAALRRRMPGFPSALSWVAGTGLYLRDLALRSGSGRIFGTVRVTEQFDDRFDALWEKVRHGTRRLRAVRTRAVLEWRFHEALKTGKVVIVTAVSGKELTGYSVLVRRDDQDLGLAVYDIADLQAEDNPVVVRDLLLGAVRAARDNNADMLKITTSDAVKRAVAVALAPYHYRVPVWQLFFKTDEPELKDELSDPKAWDFSPFDNY